MKKVNIILELLLLLVVVSCIDDGTKNATFVPDEIKIEGIKDYYQASSFIGERLVIEPDITSAYSDDELDFKWYIYDKTKEDKAYGDMPAYEATLIGEAKKLDYEVNLQSAKYTLVLEITSKKDGIMRSFTTTVDVSTMLSRGFYILKETLDGNTEVDLYNPETSDNENVFVENILTSRLGSPMDGAPRHIDISYGQGFLDPDKLAQGVEENSAGHAVCITTEKDSVKFIRVSDFRELFSGNNMYYDPPQETVKPYRVLRGYYEVYYLTDHGIYATYAGDVIDGGSRGFFGKSVDTGASVHAVTAADAFHNLIYWNETTSSLGACDFNGGYIPITSSVAGFPSQNTSYDCITCGQSKLGTNPEIIYFLLQEKNNPSKKYLYFVSSDESAVSKVVPVDAGSKLAQSSIFAVNALQASVIYSIVDNKLYAYDLNGLMAEKEIPLQGIPADETITYISNQFWNFNVDDLYNFDYLLVGTQKGEIYTLYMYKMIGEMPNGLPVNTISGTGRLEGVHYTSPLWNSNAVPNYSRVDR